MRASSARCVFALASPFFRTLPLAAHGLEWIDPPAAIAHPFDDGSAVLIERSIERSALNLDPDAGAYRNLMQRLVADWPKLERAVLGPPDWPRHPLALARLAHPDQDGTRFESTPGDSPSRRGLEGSRERFSRHGGAGGQRQGRSLL